MRLPIYLDYMATTPIDPRVAAKMTECLTNDGIFGNAASRNHSYGHAADAAIQTARQQLADLIHADPHEIIWTSGATESINLALKGVANFYHRKGKHIITATTEHKAVLDCCDYLSSRGFTITYLQPQKNGLIDLNDLEQALRDDTILVSIMHVNNEIGVIQDIAKIGELVKSRGILFHVDAAQSLGKLPINLDQLPIDLMSFSAHKMYGPKGIGALYLRSKPKVRLEPLLHGGGHEQGLRSGTLPTHQIVGFGEACRIANMEMFAEEKRILQLREYLWHGISQLEQVYLNGDHEQRVAGNLNVSFAGVNGEALMFALRNLAVSSGSACTSATIEPSHVLSALTIPDTLAQSSVRFSIGRFTTSAEIDFAIKEIQQAVIRLRNLSPLWQAA